MIALFRSGMILAAFAFAGCNQVKASKLGRGVATAPVAAPATAVPTMPDGLMLVAKFSGSATMTVEGRVVPLMVDQSVPARAKLTTPANSSLVLAFSNGAIVQLGSDTVVVLDEFLQAPFSGGD